MFRILIVLLFIFERYCLCHCDESVLQSPKLEFQAHCCSQKLSSPHRNRAITIQVGIKGLETMKYDARGADLWLRAFARYLGTMLNLR